MNKHFALKHNRNGEIKVNNKSFDSKRIAEGYKNRPFLHTQVINKLKEEDFQEAHFEYGLDIGCGAGLSTKALKQICMHVTGTDISQEMISIAREVCDSVEYDFFCEKAEEIHKQNYMYDIATAAGVIQWVNQEAFLANLYKVMRQEGKLIVYDFAISDQMIGENTYNDWWHNEYLLKFPKPYRNEKVWTNEQTERFGFHIENQTKYNLEYQFSLDAFIDFMLIQSNVNAQIENESIQIEDVRDWFRRSLACVFNNQEQILIFKGYYWVLKKCNEELTKNSFRKNLQA